MTSTDDGNSAADRQAALVQALAGKLDYPGILVEAVTWIDNRTVVLQVTKARKPSWLRYDDARGLVQLFDAAEIEAAVNANPAKPGAPAFRMQDARALLPTGQDALTFDWHQQAWLCARVDGVLGCRPTGPATDAGREWPAGADIRGPMGPGANMSPDGKFKAVRVGPNIRIETVETQTELLATSDGKRHFEYGNTVATSWSGRARVAMAGLECPVDGLWSSDSRYFLTFLTDSRHSTELPLVRSQPPGGRRVPPDVIWFKSQLATDEKLVQLVYVVLDTLSCTVKMVEMPWIDGPVDPVRNRFLLWKTSPLHGFYFLSHSRGAREITLWEAEAGDPVARVVRTEASTTRAGVTTARVQHGVQHVPGTADYLWTSDKDGRQALYHLNGLDGRLTHRLTQEDSSFLSIRHVDWEAGRVFYTGHPDASQTDPARLQLYSAALDGTGQQRHTSLDHHHEVHLSPDAGAYIDVASRVDVPPEVSLVRTADGASRHLLSSNPGTWSLPPAARPRRFRALAADGKTPLFGTMYRPSHWSPNRQYPLVDWVYGSAETAFAPEGFNEDAADLQRLAEGGLIVIKLDARGTPGRTKAFNDCGISAGHNLCGVDDHIAVMRALAEQDSSIDKRAMGAGGWSGGGQCALRFATRGQGFFKAIVIGAPSCDPFLLGPSYVEHFLGPAAESEALYREGADDPFIADVDAALLLIHGELDDDVHPAHTMRLARQLMDADRLFEMLIVPGQGHEARTGYVMRAIADFFERRLHRS